MECGPPGCMWQMCGVASATVLKVSRSRGTPASRAMAIRWSTVFDDPPSAMSTRTAFFRLVSVTISRGRMPSRMRPTARSPLSRAMRSFAASTAGMAAHPGRERPSASVTHAMVFAV